jgi:sulfur relay (sulfurtransferase) complex TusBCD TusD component (DsrE family)
MLAIDSKALKNIHICYWCCNDCARRRDYKKRKCHNQPGNRGLLARNFETYGMQELHLSG